MTLLYCVTVLRFIKGYVTFLQVKMNVFLQQLQKMQYRNFIQTMFSHYLKNNLVYKITKVQSHICKMTCTSCKSNEIHIIVFFVICHYVIMLCIVDAHASDNFKKFQAQPTLSLCYSGLCVWVAQ
uniref:Uncharacterized protein n=1 Tax=Anguilla anguilla TaxID=7936 RepID=A0A0E9W9G3_ANGAN